MSAYTKVGWDTLTNADVPPPPGYQHPWATHEPYVSRVVSGPLGCTHLAISMSRIEPGQSGEHHTHAVAEEIFVLMEGRCQMRIDDEVIELGQFDAVRVAPGVYRSVFNHSDATCWTVVMAAPIDEFIAASDDYLPAGED
jgi:quercetin dioxygenase-like cupin family protein